jgi:hypothetical protein
MILREEVGLFEGLPSTGHKLHPLGLRDLKEFSPAVV